VRVPSWSARFLGEKKNLSPFLGAEEARDEDPVPGIHAERPYITPAQRILL